MNEGAPQGYARVSVESQGQSAARGTAFCVAQGTLLTAWHVVKGAFRIVVAMGGQELEVTAHPELHDEELDWAILLAPGLASPQLPVGLLEDTDQRTWSSFGFPSALPIGLHVEGRVTSPPGSGVMQLFSPQAAAGQGGRLQGLSGSPVVVDGVVVGLISQALADARGRTEAGTLLACPMGPILAACGALLRQPDPCWGLPGLPPIPPPASPFRYLQRYEREHAPVFFGRCPELRRLLVQLEDADTPPVLLLYGQAGVGKSSLLASGLLPRLEGRVLYLRRDRDRSLLELVEGALGGPLGVAWRDREQLASLHVVLDQVEEALIAQEHDPHGQLVELAQALHRLHDAGAPPRGKLVLAFRKEWFSEVHHHLSQQGVRFANHFLLPLSKEGIVEAVEGVARVHRLREQYGLEVEPGLGWLVAEGLRWDSESPVGPTLQVLLTEMWREASRRSPSSPRFDRELLRTVSQRGYGLDDYLRQRLSELPAEHEHSGLVLDILGHHVTAIGTSRTLGERELSALYTGVSGFHQARLALERVTLLVQPGSEQLDLRGTRLVHDTLGPVIQRHVGESERPGQLARRMVESRARDEARLSREDLSLLRRGKEGMRCLTTAEAELVARSKRWWRSVQGVLLVVALVGLAGMGWLGLERNSAIQDEAAARAAEQAANLRREVQLLVAQADAYWGEDRRSEAAALLRAAVTLEDELSAPEGVTEVSARLERLAAEGGIGFKVEPAALGSVTAIAVDPKGDWMAVWSEVEGTWVVELASGEVRHRVPRLGGTIPAARGDIRRLLVADPAGEWLAERAGGRELRFWSPATGALLGELELIDGGPYAISMDGRQVAWLDPEGRLCLGRTPAGGEARCRSDIQGASILQFSDEGDLLTAVRASGGSQEVLVMDVASLEEQSRVAIRGERVNDLRLFEAEGQLLTFEYPDMQMGRYSLPSGQALPQDLMNLDWFDLSVSPKGRYRARSAEGAGFGEKRENRFDDLARGRTFATPDYNRPSTWAFHEERELVASGDWDGFAHVVNLRSGDPRGQFYFPSEMIADIHWFDSGRRLALQTPLSVWVMELPRLGLHSTGLSTDPDVAGAAWGPDVEALVFVRNDGAAEVYQWRLDERTPLLSPGGEIPRAQVGTHDVIDVSPSGQITAYSTTEGVFVADLARPGEHRRFSNQDEWVLPIKVTDDGVFALSWTGKLRRFSVDREFPSLALTEAVTPKRGYTFWLAVEGVWLLAEQQTERSRGTNSMEYQQLLVALPSMAVRAQRWVDLPGVTLAPGGQQWAYLDGSNSLVLQALPPAQEVRLPFSGVGAAQAGFSHDGDCVFGLAGGQVTFWSAADPQEPVRVSSDAGMLVHADVLRGHALAVTLAYSGLVEVWDLASGLQVDTFSIAGLGDGQRATMTLAPDGRTLALWSVDGPSLHVVELREPQGRQATVQELGARTNLRVCRDSLEVVAITPFPPAENIWAPTERCGPEGAGEVPRASDSAR